VPVLQNGRDFATAGFEELYGISPGGAVLVRPDGHVGARWHRVPTGFQEELRLALSSRSWVAPVGSPLRGNPVLC
jgi:hypothetical protein